MLAWVLALLVCFAPPSGGEQPPPSPVTPAPTEPTEPGPTEPVAADPDASEPGPTEPVAADPIPPAAALGELMLVPPQPGRYRLLASVGGFETSVEVGPGRPGHVSVPAGIYRVLDDAGIERAVVVVVAARTQVWDGDEVIPFDVWTARNEPVITPPPPPPPPEPEPQRRRRRSHSGDNKTWASPLASTFLPGLGQGLNRQPGKALALLFGTFASVAGAIGLYASKNDGRRSNAREYARLVGYGVLSTTAPLLWVYAITDAWRIANGEPIEPKLDHKVRVSLGRTMTVGFRADPRRPGFYDDWSVAIMGQATKRLTVGISDVGLKPGSSTFPQVWQFGVRLDYRVYEHPRLWLDLGLGTAMQLASFDRVQPLDPEAERRTRERVFGATPYGYFDLRCFVLDRMSIDFTPRLSVPVTTRYFSADRALPRFAPSLELGAGISAYF